MAYTNNQSKTPWKSNGRWMPWYLTFSQTWGNRKSGRYWKRALSKARRRAWKHELMTGKPYNKIVGLESEVNFRGW